MHQRLLNEATEAGLFPPCLRLADRVRTTGNLPFPAQQGCTMAKRRKSDDLVPMPLPEYGALIAGISELLDQARHAAARAVNRLLTATYWDIGRRIVEFEQGGKARAPYGVALLKRLAAD